MHFQRHIYSIFSDIMCIFNAHMHAYVNGFEDTHANKQACTAVQMYMETRRQRNLTILYRYSST